MADVVDRHVVMLAPEEWHRVEFPACADHVERGDLTLAFRDDPMLDANPRAAMRIGPARDVAGGEDTGRGRLEVCVDRHAFVDGKPCLLRQCAARPPADT